MGEENKKKSYEVGELDHYLFGKGNHYEIYKKLGSHMIGGEEKKRSLFCSMGSACERSFGSW